VSVPRVLAVCLGNICRSPAAEAAIREAAAAAGVAVDVDSAGTAGYHSGEPPDRRIREAGERLGLGVAGTARPVTREDFHRFDLIVAMDRENVAALRRLAPAGTETKIRLFRSFDPDADGDEVPDPYYGGEEGFRDVVGIVRPAARGLVAALSRGEI